MYSFKRIYLYILSILLLALSYSSVSAYRKDKLKSEFQNTNVVSQDNAVKNMMWEKTLISTKNYQNPYRDVVLSVQYFNSDSSIVFNAHGFWDGDSVFKIRSYFPEVGEWTWKTTCSNNNDTGLHNKSGSITVTEYSGSNKIYKHGGLKMSANDKYLMYEDGTPFFWMGGTGWALPMAATYGEWKKYIDDRHSKKFDLVQVAPARAHGGIFVDPPYDYPANWKGDKCFFSEDKWNPLYWQEFDRFVEYANSKEMIVVITGLAEPVHDDMNIEYATLFARNFSARMKGYHVILSPAFDTWQDYQRSDLDSIGTLLKDSRHLISQHTGHSYVDTPVNEHAKYFRDRSYMDFSMNQSGHNGGDLDRCYKKARVWNINLLNSPPVKKAVVNTETLYSAGKYASEITIGSRKGTDENARALGWLSILSGSLGYSYGAQGIWNYGEKTDSTINLTIPFDSALAFVSSVQMEYLVNFFNAINWWELEPNHDAIIYNGSVSEEKKMALAISETGKFGAAFLPDANSIKIDMTVFSNSVDATWFNPITAEYTSGEQNVTNSGQHTFTPPSPGEWALLLDNSVTLSVRIFLEGPYSGHKMTTNLSSVIPFEQPYNVSPWNYSGNETIDDSFTNSNKIVDWVLVELRTGVSPGSATNVVARKAVPVNEDGFIIDPNYRTTNVKFGVDPGEYFIVVYHRNHLAVMSSQKVMLN
ncbi:putative endoglucanase [bacterium BMS3Abin04]|nr:putative endoglucanase [bacterium BMS3Abin04]